MLNEPGNPRKAKSIVIPPNRREESRSPSSSFTEELLQNTWYNLWIRLVLSIIVLFSLALSVSVVLYFSAYIGGSIIYEGNNECTLSFPSVSRSLSSNWETTPLRFYETCSTSGKISLTFDDGPVMTLNATNLILDSLRDQSIPGTFFLSPMAFKTGTLEEKCDLVKRIIDEGHYVGSHSWSHPDLATLTDEQFLEEVFITESWITTCAGYRPLHFRPPFGSLTVRQGRMLADLGYVVSFWNLDTQDFTHPNDLTGIIDEVVDAVESYQNSFGEPRESIVMLQHDFQSATVPEVIGDIKTRFNAYQFIRVDACFIDHKAFPSQCRIEENGQVVATACLDKNENNFQVSDWGFNSNG